jgi:hypothetical protein
MTFLVNIVFKVKAKVFEVYSFKSPLSISASDVFVMGDKVRLPIYTSSRAASG